MSTITEHYTPRTCDECHAQIGGWDQASADRKYAEHMAQHHIEPTFVDARFAGGAIQIERDAEYLGDGRAVVVLSLPGHTVALFPHEARALAAALSEQAEEGGR